MLHSIEAFVILPNKSIYKIKNVENVMIFTLKRPSVEIRPIKSTDAAQSVFLYKGYGQRFCMKKSLQINFVSLKHMVIIVFIL